MSSFLYLLLPLLLLGGPASISDGFSPLPQLPSSSRRKECAAPLAAVTKENWTYNPFDVNDLSPLDTLMRRGPIPFAVRLARADEYEKAVVQYMRKDGCDRATAQRNMDKFFNDPSGWVVAKARERDLGENFGDINAPTGVQKRPVFSALWATFCFWIFFVFFPTRIEELGGIQPSYSSNGMCNLPIRTESGKLVCPQNENVIDYV